MLREMSQNSTGNFRPLPRGFRTREYRHCVTNQILQISRKIWSEYALTEGTLPLFSRICGNYNLGPQSHFHFNFLLLSFPYGENLTSMSRYDFILFYEFINIFMIPHTLITFFKFKIWHFTMHCGRIWDFRSGKSNRNLQKGKNHCKGTAPLSAKSHSDFYHHDFSYIYIL